MPDASLFLISSDSEGLFGHECPMCHRYWRSRGQSSVCGYCGWRGDSFQFLTVAQVSYVEHYAEVLRTGLDSVGPGEQKEVVIDMDAIVDGAPDIPKPAFYYPGTSQQTRFDCMRCKTKNDIRGRFGYCCACGLRNNLSELRSQIDAIRSDLNEARVAPEKSVKRIVSAFDACCRDFVAQLATLPMRNRRRQELQQLLFHGIEAPAELLKRAFDIDILRGLEADVDSCA